MISDCSVGRKGGRNNYPGVCEGILLGGGTFIYSDCNSSDLTLRSVYTYRLYM